MRLFKGCGWLACLLASAAIGSAQADEEADKAAIALRLRHWAEAFNVRNAAGVCDLFAPDLIATVPGAPDRGRSALCGNLASLLADRAKTMRYTPDIHEIIVSGDLAVARLTWTLTVESGSAKRVGEEHGLDVFRRQPDGAWAIARFIAFSAQ